MEKRRSNRIKHRLTCELLVGRETYSAVVRDLAPTGLFVQTRARPNANSVVEVRFPATAGLPGFSIEVGVARHRNVHPRLQAEIQSGIGLEILGRPADYLAYAKRAVEPRGVEALPLAAPAAARTAPSVRSTTGHPSRSPALPNRTHAASKPAEHRRFRVRLMAIGPSAPRTLVIQASSIAAARAEAMTRCGAGWKITDVETV
ncbi:PilZ domain-containing protein [Myxococcota bacterium]|nr:PilZ domain-containing protein [Myxococcota bacterium]